MPYAPEVYPVVPSLRQGPEREFIVMANGQWIRLPESQLKKLRLEIKRALRG